MAQRDVHMDSESDNNELPGGEKKQRACDICRSRKIRCDKASPCSNCRASNQVCKTTQQVKQPRQRVLISNQYEKKIDAIENRLAGIEQILQILNTRLAGSLRMPSNTQSPASHGPSHVEAVLSPEPAFEGDTTLNAHSVFAQEVLERAVENSPMTGQNLEMSAALSSLQGIVSRLNIQAATHETTSEYPFSHGASISSVQDLKLPPQNYVKKLIDKTTEYTSVTFTKFFPFLPISEFKELCAEVYQENGDCSQAKLIIFYGGLFYLFYEYSSMQVGHPMVQFFEEYSNLCRQNLEVVLSSLNLLMPATLENVQALLIGSSYSVETSKPSMCWIFNSTAASLSMSLGYHRKESMKNDPESERERKTSIFWCVPSTSKSLSHIFFLINLHERNRFIYVMDKNLSLRLGRASVIQDYDISIPRPSTFKKSKSKSSAMSFAMNSYWVQVSEIQGQVYKYLYSPGSFSRLAEERQERAKLIASSLRQCHEGRAMDFYSEDFMGDFSQLLVHSDQVVYHSIMTLIYRAIPPSGDDPSTSFSTDCIEAARASLQAHLTCASMYKYKNERLWAGYAQWSILNIPFTPYMVIFCHVIALYSTSDLDLLASFVTSLKPTGEVNSEGIEKLYRLCQVFYQVAKVYVGAKAQEARTEAQSQASLNLSAGGKNAMTEFRPEAAFDPYLSMLGFAPNQAQYMVPTSSNWVAPAGIATEWPQDMDFGNVNIQDWFSGSSNIMGLMDQNIDYINMG